MLYEVITIPPVMNNDGATNSYDIAVRQFKQQILPGGIVITSYSIHYTKLYEYRRGGVEYNQADTSHAEPQDCGTPVDPQSKSQHGCQA